MILIILCIRQDGQGGNKFSPGFRLLCPCVKLVLPARCPTIKSALCNLCCDVQRLKAGASCMHQRGTMSSLLLLLIFSTCTASTAPAYPHHARRVAALRRQAPVHLLHSPSINHRANELVPRSARSANGLHVTPASMGGDPTGRRDSSDALELALATCLNQSALSPNGLFPGSDSFPEGLAIRDMGGCFIDLDGGEYLMSRPCKEKLLL